MSESKDINNALTSLADYLKETVRHNYALAEIVAKGVTYHHGKLPQHVRKVIEFAISQKMITNVVCTTTLMQGVNMPAQNVIVRNPHLYINDNGGGELTSYEMANLRGRAGRLLKDFIGRSFVLDENEFLKVSDEYQQDKLFEDTYKELDSSYAGIYNKNADDISTAVADSIPSTKLPKEYAFIVTHIRQTILRHNADAMERLSKIGITISQKQFVQYVKALTKLVVPKSICLANRYFDPEILNMLYIDQQQGKLPELPNGVQRGAQSRLNSVLKYLRDNDNYNALFESRIPERFHNGQQRGTLCEMAVKWTKQTPLKQILSGAYYDDADKVDDAINTLQNTVSYDLPVLLKPLYDIKGLEAIFITFLEAGAFQPIARKLIEIGIPRETAIFIFDHYFDSAHVSGDDVYDAIIRTIRSNIPTMPYWVKVQLSAIA